MIKPHDGSEAFEAWFVRSLNVLCKMARDEKLPTGKIVSLLVDHAAGEAYIAQFTRQQFRHHVNKRIKSWWGGMCNDRSTRTNQKDF